jgi:hypothetical protein
MSWTQEVLPQSNTTGQNTKVHHRQDMGSTWAVHGQSTDSTYDLSSMATSNQHMPCMFATSSACAVSTIRQLTFLHGMSARGQQAAAGDWLKLLPVGLLLKEQRLSASFP